MTISMKALLVLMVLGLADVAYSQVVTPQPETIRVKFICDFTGSLDGWEGKTFTLTEKPVYLYPVDENEKPKPKFQNMYHREFFGDGPNGSFIRLLAAQGGNEKTGVVWIVTASIWADGVVTNSNMLVPIHFSTIGRYEGPLWETYWRTDSKAKIARPNGLDPKLPVGKFIINP